LEEELVDSPLVQVDLVVEEVVLVLLDKVIQQEQMVEQVRQIQFQDLL
jgi:hypothetical protein